MSDDDETEGRRVLVLGVESEGTEEHRRDKTPRVTLCPLWLSFRSSDPKFESQNLPDLQELAPGTPTQES
jgi:hypothetical protein